MTKNVSYRDSHTIRDKGRLYDQFYKEDEWTRFLWSQEQRALNHILCSYFPNKDIHLLDYACGTGRITRFLEDKTTSCVGVDLSSSMLDEARNKLRHTELIQADLTADNILRGREFNLITSFRFFVNAENTLRLDVIKVLAALLSDDGILVFNNHHNLCAPYVRAGKTWSKIRTATPYNTMSIRQMKDLAAAADLRIVELLPVGFFHIPKINISEAWCCRIEKVARMLRLPARWSESPIAICRHRHAACGRDRPDGV